MKTLVFGTHDQNTLDQMEAVAKNAEKTVLCADGHLGYVQPIGGVAAYKDKVSPVGVGFDIGCGNCAVRLDMKEEDLEVGKALDIIQKEIAFGVGQTNPRAPRSHSLFEKDSWESYPKEFREKLKELGRSQLGTVGSGNHYVDLFVDENKDVWIGVHFGSRGLGHKTASGFLNLSFDRYWDEKNPPEKELLLNIHSSIGQDYWRCMEIAGGYARVGREWVCIVVAIGLGADILETVHNHHNFAWQEKHGGEDYVVVRKGATPAFPGQKGFVGGSMGDDAVIIQGVDSEKSKASLYSTVHGAGRVMGRREAAGRGKWKKVDGKRTWVQKSEGKIKRPEVMEWLKNKGVEVRGSGLDEAPQAYRRLPDVLLEHIGTIEILHYLRPVGVVMAGDGYDPYKD